MKSCFVIAGSSPIRRKIYIFIALNLSVFGFFFNFSYLTELAKKSIPNEASHAKDEVDEISRKINNKHSPPSVPEVLALKGKLNAALLEAKKKDAMKLIILIWEPPFGTKNQIHINYSSCGNCDILYDQTKIDDPDTKAVVLHFENLSHMPLKRRRDQYYVWMTMESTVALSEMRQLKLNEYNNVFNLTMTYRRDSDVYFPCGYMGKTLNRIRRSSSGDYNKDIDDLISRKSGLAIWIVSNCDGTIGAKKRMYLVHKLVEAGLRLDRRGACFPENGKANVNDISKYKFYIAFENAIHCKNYITEKLFYNGFRMGTVPIVYGATKRDYQAVAPSGSYIFAEDYSPESLVAYLNYLDKNVTAYREYFEWRTEESIEMPDYGRKGGYCQLCRIIHDINIDNIYNERSRKLERYIPLFGKPNRSRIVPSIRNWFYGKEYRECLPSY